MPFGFQFFAPVILSLLVVFYSKKYYVGITQDLGTDSENPALIIGILSSQDNFAYREAVRSTWLKTYGFNKNNSVKAYFIIGKASCNIPPEHRLNKYSCEKIPLNISGIRNHFSSSHNIDFNLESSQTLKRFHQGFSFKTNHPLVVKKLGVVSSLLAPNTEAKVAILDVQTKVSIVQAIVSSNDSQTSKGYYYQSVEEILLPKNFEGMVLVEGYLFDSSRTQMSWDDGGGVITYLRIYTSLSHLDSIQYSPESFVAPSIEFHVNDINSLKKYIREEEEVTNQWKRYVRNLSIEINLEAAKYADVLLIDVVDTYRNLPSKLLRFYKWLENNHEYSFVMKTDDDTVIDVNRLLQKLQDDVIFNSSNNWLLSRFRKEWPVNYIGKWADYDYRSTVYPAFPCGAAYIIPSKIASWLNSNSDQLFPYQGEDVSMGIWLSAIKPEYIEDENFECDAKCQYFSYNRAQLTPAQIYDVWSTYEKCSNLCSCE